MSRFTSRTTSTSALNSLAAAGALAVLLAAGAVACGPAKGSATSSDSGGAAKPAASAPAKQEKNEKNEKDKAPAKPTAKPAFKGDGTYRVGTDIQPGTYLTSGNKDDMCYWERAKDAKGDADSILANDNVTGSSYVTITKTDRIFKTTGCSDWYAVTAKKTGAPKSSMSGDGMYKVGTDILPGTYRSAGSTDGNCYWERSKDALHGVDSITANDNATGSAIVTIAGSDAYFKTSGCADWHKTG